MCLTLNKQIQAKLMRIPEKGGLAGGIGSGGHLVGQFAEGAVILFERQT